MAKQLNVNMVFDADTSKAKQSINELTQALNKLGYGAIPNSNNRLIDAKEFEKAAAQARELSYHLNNAFNTQTGKLDLSKLNTSLRAAGTDLGKLTENFNKAGPAGQEAFLKVAQAISNADQPVMTMNSRVSTLFVTLKNVARFQISSSIMHGLIGGVQTALGYARNLDESLNNIRIVTGQSTEQMAIFAEQANKAAKALSSTTLDYTRASLIYYQQGLSDAEVANRTATTLKLANVSRQSAEEVSDQMTAIWNNFDDGSKSLEYYADVITALGASTASSSDEIARGVSKFAAVADTVGLSYEYATTALATLVAETRQSADTVGTGLRTLFTRLQSLELGDTLEDGTNLTKYSKALKIIGVNIKEENGALKDMDQILTEVAGKWDLLAKDQQVALAQTVGGVRQYVNFIALMDNWETFQRNLTITNTSQGTLQKQAEIYAESWEAARDRVKVASEEVYSSLIDEEFFINVDDVLSSILSGTAKFIDELGGVKGLLVTIFGIVATSMSNQIGPMLERFVLNLKVLTGGANRIYQQQNSEFQGIINREIQTKNYTDSEEAQLKGYANLLSIKTQLSRVTDSLSAKEKMEAEIAIQGIEMQQQKLISLTQEKEKLINQKNDTKLMFLSDNMYDSTKEPLVKELNKQLDNANDPQLEKSIQATADHTSNVLTEAREKIFNAFEEYLNSTNEKKNEIQYKISDLFGNLFQNINFDKTTSDLENEIQKTKIKLQSSLSTMFNDLSLGNPNSQINQTLKNNLSQLGLSSIDDIKTLDVGKINNLLQKISELGPTAKANLTPLVKALTDIKTRAEILSPSMMELQNKFKLLGKAFGDASKYSTTLQSALNKISNARSPEQLLNGIQRLQEAFQQGTITGAEMKDVLIAMGASESQIKSFESDSKNLNKILQELSGTTNELNNSIASLNFSHTVGGLEALTSMAAMAGNIASAINSVRSAWNTLNNDEATATEKLTTSLMAISMLLPTILSLKTNLVKVSTFLIQSTTVETAKTLANTAASSAENFVETKNIITKNLLIAGINKEIAATAAYTIAKNAAAFSTEALATAEGKATAITLLEAAGIEHDTAAKITNIAATNGLAISTGALMGVLSGLVIVIGTIVAAFVLWNKHLHENRDEYEKYSKTVEKVNKKFEEATETYNELKSTIENYKNSKNALEQLNSTTDEWKTTLEKTNEYAINLMKIWPELASKMQIDANGVISFANQDETFQEAERQAKIAQVQAQVEAAKADYYRKNKAVGAKEESIYGKYSGLAYSKDDVNKAVDLYTKDPRLKAFSSSIKDIETIIDDQLSGFWKQWMHSKNPAAFQKDRADAIREQLQKYGINDSEILGLDNSKLNTFFDILRDSDFDSLIEAVEEYNNANEAFGLEVQSAANSMLTLFDTDNSGLAGSLLKRKLTSLDKNDLTYNEQVADILEKTQTYVDLADELAKAFDNDQSQINAIIAALQGNGQIGNIKDFTLKELNSFKDKFIQHWEQLGYESEEKASEAADKLLNSWETEYEKVVTNDLPKYIQEDTKDLFDLLKNQVNLADASAIKTALADALNTGSDLTAYKSLVTIFKELGPNAGDFARELSNINWNTITTVEDLAKKLNLTGDAAKNLEHPLQQLIDLMKEAAGITFDEAAEKYKNAQKVVPNLEYGKEISSEDYGYLQEYEDQINAYLDTHDSEFNSLRHYFSRTASGGYNFKGDEEEFQNIFNTVVLEEFNKGLQDAVESFRALKEVAPTEEEYQEKYNKASESIAGMLDFISTIQGDNVSPDVKIAEELYNQNSSSYQGAQGMEAFAEANPDEYEKLRQIFESLKNLYPELAQEIEDYEESINSFKEAVDGIDAEKLKALDPDISNDALKERVAFLKEYGTELYGINKETLNNTEAIRLIAEEMLRAEAAAKRFQSSWKDWLEGFQSGKITIQMLQDLENTYSDLLNLSQNTHLSQSFLESADNAWFLKEALDGNIEAYNTLLERASDDIIYNSFEEIRQGIEERAIELNLEIDPTEVTNHILSEMDRIQDQLYEMGDIQIGMEIDPDKYADFYAELDNLINEAGWAADEATRRLCDMGIDADIVQETDTKEDTDEYHGATPEITQVPTESTFPIQLADGTISEQKGTGSVPSVNYVSGPSQNISSEKEATGFALKVKSARKSYGSGGNISHKKLHNTSSGVTPSRSSGVTPSRSSGGGSSSSSGSEKKPRSLTAHVKADAGERYHTIQKRLDNVKKVQDEATRRKERAFGAEKIAQLEKEISLRKESLKLQSDYMKEIQEFLVKDKSDMTSQLGALGIKIEIDKDGVISNYQEIQDALLDMENALIDEENKYNATGDEIPDSIDKQKTALKDAKKAISQYEETLGKLEDQIYSTAAGIDELNDVFFELITTKIELKINIADDEAKLLEYFLEKYSDDAYKAAEAISIFGKQTANTLDKIKIYETGLVDLLKSKDMTMADLSNLNDRRVRTLIENGDFTQEQIEQIRDWRDSILEANQALLEMRGNIADKVLNVFDEFNDKVQTQYDLFSHYKNTLQVYKDITDLMGRSVNKEQKKLISDLNNAMLENSKNTIETAKKRYEDLVIQRSEAQALYDTALAEGGEDAAREYEELLETLDSEIKNSEEEYLSSWQETMEQAQAIFEQMIEDITDKFDEAMSGAFGSLDYLKEAFGRQSENEDLYLQDYDKLYELNKLQRDLNKTLSDTRGVTNRKELLEIQRQINEYQVEGVQLSQYDLEALRAKLEMQQAYNDLQIAQDAKHTVRLSRDAEGNWGYIYTANQEEIAQAEQQYEDKLHAYQELNDNYIQELQEKALEVQTTYREILTEIMKDTTLDDQQRRARIEELNEWLANQQNYFNDQSLNAFNNQADTMDRMLGAYQASGADLIDLWEKTKLANLTGMDSIQDYMNNWITTSNSFLYSMYSALDNRQKMLDNILELTETSISQFGNQVSSVITNIGNVSGKAQHYFFDLSNLLNEEFSKALAQAVNWEKEYANGIVEMTQQNEKMIASLNNLIATLGTLHSYNYLHDSRNYSSDKISKKFDDELFEAPSLADKFDDGLFEATSLDTGGYTGSWGSEGKIAILHEHEQIFNEDDTNNLLEAATILRQIDISTMSMAQGLGNLFSPSIGGFEQTLQQEVHIEAVFPDATDHNEIEEAFDNLVNRAIQYANRKI